MNESPLVDAVLRPVRSHMAFESCVEQLGSAIQLGVFRQGSKLPNERELSERLNVSRATLREAISALRAAGFVSTTRGRGGGTVVESIENARPLDPIAGHDRQSEITDLIIFRSIVEPGACYHAASARLDADARDQLAACLEELEHATSPTEYRQADARLHLTICSVCGSPELSKAYSVIQTKIHQFLSEIPFLQKNIENSNEQHRRIVRAILDGDADTARFVMEEHCGATASLLKGLLK
jgi:GntR family transcriptional regulator, transcriptional repressor for pyruvate dehydrogenase complex